MNELGPLIQDLLKKVEKPARYVGGEINSIIKDLSQVELKVALVMPETYEIAQSNLGLKILYEVLNLIPNVCAERVYAPWEDFEEQLRKNKVSPFSLENKIPLEEFDLIGISLPYELSYTNILTLLNLANIPFYSKDRDDSHPFILGGGNQAFNPEPIADFFDAFVVGDGEEAIVHIVQKILEFKKIKKEKSLDFFHKSANVSSSRHGGSKKPEFTTVNEDFLDTVTQKLERAAIYERSLLQKKHLFESLISIEGVYIPSFFEVHYEPSGIIQKIEAKLPHYKKVKKATVKNLDTAVFPTSPVVPSVQTIHDRLSIEVQRGCVRACRFCQAGYIYRPERQRSPEQVLKIIEDSLPNTGDEQVSLLSLSIGDYGCLIPLVREIVEKNKDKRISVSLPATRTDTFSPEVIQEIKRVRKTGITLAPEAGTPRLRRVINKGNLREDLFRSVENIFKEDWQLIKFYYMCGLPYETEEDLKGIIEEANEALKIGRKYSSRAKINLNVSPHVPKPHTPFQWEAQDSLETSHQKITYLKSLNRNKGIELKYHSPEESFLEGIFARGDRRLAKAIVLAWEKGCRFDGWREKLRFDEWMNVLAELHLNPEFYVSRRRSLDEVLPWDHLFSDLKKEFLIEELKHAEKEAAIPDCSTGKCSDCGICDFKEVKNINYKVENEVVLTHSTRGRKLETTEPTLLKKQIENFSKGLDPFKNLNQEEKTSSALASQKVFIYRCRFSKIASASFLSHLELMNVLRRALSRAKVPLRFSSGYHPQPKLALSQALPVGTESISEYFDMELSEEISATQFKNQINPCLPHGIEVLECVLLHVKPKSLSSSIYASVWEVTLPNNFAGGEEKLKEKIEWLKQQEELICYRKRQNGFKKINISPYIEELRFFSPKHLQLTTKVLQEKSTRPQEILEHLLEGQQELKAQAKILKVESLLTEHAQ